MNNLIMGFTQPCFIRKNTPELRKKLEELGYTTSSICKSGNIATSSTVGKYSIISDWHWNSTNPHTTWNNGNRIYCGENEELFLAIAALRDDSDYMQWFVCPKTRTRRMAGCFGQVVGMDGHYQEIVGYEWYRHENKDNALTERLDTMIQMEVEDMEFLPHKATVEEIIEHFNKK
jgi:hypothetical protein